MGGITISKKEASKSNDLVGWMLTAGAYCWLLCNLTCYNWKYYFNPLDSIGSQSFFTPFLAQLSINSITQYNLPHSWGGIDDPNFHK